jgi:uncharacterized protein YkwD
VAELIVGERYRPERDSVRLCNPAGVGRVAFRLTVAVAVVVATGSVAASALATSKSERGVPALNRQVLAAVNRFRVARGRVPLKESGALDRSARQHSLEMGRLGYFGHPSANGTAFWKRIQHYYPAKGDSYWSVGENLLWRSPNVTAPKAMGLWIASPEHLKNLLATQWRQIGISSVHVVRAPGVFHGLPVTIITTDFGVRR